MPGKPYRQKLWADFQPPDHSPALTADQRVHFLYWLIQALLARLSKKSEKEARAARAGIQYAFRWAKHLLTLPNVTEEKAFQMAAVAVATWPEKKIVAALEYLDHRNPVAIFAESVPLLETIQKLPATNARQKWLHSLNQFSAKELENLYTARPAQIVEAVLAKRHATSKGRIHKLLAQASAMFKHQKSSRQTSRKPRS